MPKTILKPKPGKSLADIRPDMAAVWHPTLNGELTPKDVTPNSTYNAWWTCDKGHAYDLWVTRLNRNPTFTCMVCANTRIQKGVNDLFTIYPHLKAEWDFEKNTADPYQIRHKGKEWICWVCPLGHNYTSVIGDRTTGRTNCQYCSGHKVLIGFNDLGTLRPDLVLEFDLEANDGQKVTDFTLSTPKVVNWKCSLGHTWPASIQARTRKKKRTNCPTCGNRKFLEGFNDLATRYPELAAEFDVTENEITPNKVFAGGRYTYHWICSKDDTHKWPALLNNRITAKSGCPECKSGSTSKIETAIRKNLIARSMLTGIQDSYRNKLDIPWLTKNFMVVDIFGTFSNKKGSIRKAVIEYDGEYWHHQRGEIDLKQTKLLISQGIYVIRLRGGKLKKLNFDHEMFIQIETGDYRIDDKNINLLCDKIEQALISFN